MTRFRRGGDSPEVADTAANRWAEHVAERAIDKALHRLLNVPPPTREQLTRLLNDDDDGEVPDDDPGH